MENFPTHGYGPSQVCVNHSDRVSYAVLTLLATHRGEYPIALDAGVATLTTTASSTQGASDRAFLNRPSLACTRSFRLTSWWRVSRPNQSIPLDVQPQHDVWSPCSPRRVLPLDHARVCAARKLPDAPGVELIYLFILVCPSERMMGRWKFTLICSGYREVPGAVSLFHYRGVVGASGGVYSLYGAFFVLLLLRRQKDTTPLYSAHRVLTCVQTSSAEFSHCRTLWRLYRWRARDLLIIRS